MAYFRPKATVTEREDKNPYVTYWPHSIPRTDPKANVDPGEFIQVISIDPGIVNYAIRIEKRYFNGWIIPVYFDVWQLRKRGKVDPNLPNVVYATLSRKLDEIKEHIMGSHMVVIERQLAVNYKSTRVMQHTISYFDIVLRDSPLYPTIYDVMPQLKGKMLGAPPRISKSELKDWAVMKARELFDIRRDEWSSKVMDMTKKKDDLGDTVCQVEALFIYWNAEPQTRPLPDNADDFHPLKANRTKRTIKIAPVSDNKNTSQLTKSSQPKRTIKIARR